jgi:hypothetical protein
MLLWKKIHCDTEVDINRKQNYKLANPVKMEDAIVQKLKKKTNLLANFTKIIKEICVW